MGTRGAKTGWITTSYQIPPSLQSDIKAFAAKHRVTLSHLVVSLYMALLTGDIQIERDLNRRQRHTYAPHVDVAKEVKIEFFDKDGNLLNPTYYDGEME